MSNVTTDAWLLNALFSNGPCDMQSKRELRALIDTAKTYTNAIPSHDELVASLERLGAVGIVTVDEGAVAISAPALAKIRIHAATWRYLIDGIGALEAFVRSAPVFSCEAPTNMITPSRKDYDAAVHRAIAA